MSLNKLLIIGNLGSDPELRYTPNGKPVTSFTVATNHKYTTSDGEKKEEVEWFTVTAWNQLAESCNLYLAKGKRVYIEGRLKSSTWTGQDGQTRFRNEINASTVLFLDPTGSKDDAEPVAAGEGAAPEGKEGDLPW